jgi:hypothetical protein
LHGQRVGYVHVSSFDQNAERQLEDVAVDRVFTVKAYGKDVRRPQLDDLLGFVREGDSSPAQGDSNQQKHKEISARLRPALGPGNQILLQISDGLGENPL